MVHSSRSAGETHTEMKPLRGASKPWSLFSISRRLRSAAARFHSGASESAWLTQAAVAAPLVARRALAGEGASGVVAGLLRAASVSAGRTFVHVCKTSAAVSGATAANIKIVVGKEKQNPTDVFGLRDLGDLWCVNGWVFSAWRTPRRPRQHRHIHMHKERDVK